MSRYHLDYLSELESESIYVLREVAGQFDRPVLLFSGGKDSILLTVLARKAFYPGRMPFPLLHIDTGHNFAETLQFRDQFVERMQANLMIRTVQQSIDSGRVQEDLSPNSSRNKLQSITLLDAISEGKFDCAIGGGRRDEEKARAKERFFSFRDRYGGWDPKNQRPEIWNLFNGAKNPGEHFRVFPLSNWTELDVWRYIQREKIAMPSLYFSHEREVVRRDGIILARSPFVTLLPGESWTKVTVRFRTIGDMTCTGATESRAERVEDVVREIELSRTTERGARADDKSSDAAMEDRKRQGYF